MWNENLFQTYPCWAFVMSQLINTLLRYCPFVCNFKVSKYMYIKDSNEHGYASFFARHSNSH